MWLLQTLLDFLGCMTCQWLAQLVWLQLAIFFSIQCPLWCSGEMFSTMNKRQELSGFLCEIIRLLNLFVDILDHQSYLNGRIDIILFWLISTEKDKLRAVYIIYNVVLGHIKVILCFPSWIFKKSEEGG